MTSSGWCFFCRKNHAFQNINGKPVCVVCALPYQIGLKEGKDDAVIEMMREKIDRMERRLSKIEIGDIRTRMEKEEEE